ncbi:MAG: NnrS family protein [Rhodoferax sp.]|uniref:NnrS family protein n=1 Tax=Rhodoferax sp. TaxID=50421 RepID=UPI0026213778|nr:NnrS family protein [Rhodoferax sp.]MDD5336006.1 NnrS family protein [Rhodoferax sp.]
MKLDSLPIFTAAQAAAPPPRGIPLLRLGFRPFYIGGALLAALAVPLWIAMFLGQLQWTPNAPALLWHAHEMLFGFAVAIIVGFLLTAGKAWTGLATPRGPALGALALLWLAARFASVAGPYALYALLDLALLPLVAAILVNLLLRARNHRNLPLALLLALLAGANLLFHLALLQVVPVSVLTPLHAALALIVLIECVMAGRVIPAFTMAVTPGLKLSATAGLERLTLGATGLGLTLWVFAAPGLLTLALLALASVLHVKRLWAWRPGVTGKRPILWILHAAYAWIPIGLALLALAQIGVVPVSAGIHALAVGATGGLVIGMITRTARGHTGRLLQVSRLEVLAYGLVLGAAVLRVLLPLLAPGWLAVWLIAAAAAWSVAFLLYLWVFTPWLLRTRLDGKDG